MRIISVDIPSPDQFAGGLKPLKMQKLENIVLIAGRNGSGKSRLLRALEGAVNRIQFAIPNSEYEKAIAAHTSQIARYRALSAVDGSRQAQIEHFEKQLDQSKEEMGRKSWIKCSAQGKPTLIRYVPKSTQLSDCYNLSPQSLDQHSRSLNGLDVNSLPGTCFPKIQFIQNNRRNATHPDFQGAKEVRDAAIQEYEKLTSAIKTFLGTELSRSVEGNAELFGLRLGEAQLSEGQAVLLQLCMALYTHADKLGEIILLLDEPENHLHPAARECRPSHAFEG